MSVSRVHAVRNVPIQMEGIPAVVMMGSVWKAPANVKTMTSVQPRSVLVIKSAQIPWEVLNASVMKAFFWIQRQEQPAMVIKTSGR